MEKTGPTFLRVFANQFLKRFSNDIHDQSYRTDSLSHFLHRNFEKSFWSLPEGGTGLEKSKDDPAQNESNSLVAHVELVTVLYLFLKNILGQKKWPYRH